MPRQRLAATGATPGEDMAALVQPGRQAFQNGSLIAADRGRGQVPRGWTRHLREIESHLRRGIRHPPGGRVARTPSALR